MESIYQQTPDLVDAVKTFKKSATTFANATNVKETYESYQLFLELMYQAGQTLKLMLSLRTI